MQLIITDQDFCWGEVLALLNSGTTRYKQENLPLVTATPNPIADSLGQESAAGAVVPAGSNLPVPIPLPVPPPPPFAPHENVPTAPPPPSAPTRLDVTGMPWDHRIHSEVKKLNANGTWRLRRNLDAALHEQVKAEYAAAGFVAASLPGIASTAAVTPPPPPPAAEPAPPPPPPAAEPAPMTFSEACIKITTAITAKQITKDDVPAALGRMGLPNLAVLASQPVLIPTLLKELGL